MVHGHCGHWQPYARVDFIPQSGTLDLATELMWLFQRGDNMENNVNKQRQGNGVWLDPKKMAQRSTVQDRGTYRCPNLYTGRF
jgi:hypothetical protein